jgi:hypothetical protein
MPWLLVLLSQNASLGVKHLKISAASRNEAGGGRSALAGRGSVLTRAQTGKRGLADAAEKCWTSDLTSYGVDVHS